VSRDDHHDAWREYWAPGVEGDAVTGGAGGAELAKFWGGAVDRLLSSAPEALNVLDVASGTGAAAEAVRESARRCGVDVDIVLCDISRAALRSALARVGGNAVGVACDAAQLPFKAQALDLLVSQFGVEYAGVSALNGLPDVLAPGGSLIVAAHVQGGAIAKECAINATVIEALLASGLLALTRQAIETGDPVALVGKGIIEPIAEAANAASGSAAGAFAARITPDLVKVASRPFAFEPAAIRSWLSKQEAAVQAYAGRMASMQAAALSSDLVYETISAWRSAGLNVSRPGRLYAGAAQKPFAWTLEGHRAERPV